MLFKDFVSFEQTKNKVLLALCMDFGPSTEVRKWSNSGVLVTRYFLTPCQTKNHVEYSSYESLYDINFVHLVLKVAISDKMFWSRVLKLIIRDWRFQSYKIHV